MQRLDSLDKQVKQLADSKPYKEIVGLLKCFHGKMPCKATTAVARELAGFIWSVFREYQARNMEKAA